ncbi:glycine cleavage system H protein [Desulfosarcina ovata subsp. sediminis]|uniref:Glycine cleavage system H protein n=1 Tax=Desulfosarcina ovata subsp. sediminis TaxID=885957 RepID=A0A5K7ZU22_9BACT|nr:glycine cleavage system protein GcvH [Desulfosarcina ovata]BBO83674.1 glycine cleavage system H protein [Desulfosarcina ovata subsp. sediminis]
MKEISELKFPDDRGYTDDHEWAQKTGDGVRIGISDYAQDQLGDVVFVELPDVGSSFAKGEEFGTVESVKAVSELYMPIGGEVTAVNEALADQPERVNTDPYESGWMIEVKAGDPSEREALKSKADYLEMLKG